MNMRSRQSILSSATFGSRIAEDELDRLQLYFVETEQWRRVLSGDADIIFGAKGSGKSALYSLLVAQKEDLRLGRRTIFLAAENPRGTPAFRDLTTQPPLSEEHFRGLWKLYFLSILANYIRHHLDTTRTDNPVCAEVVHFLVTNGLLAPNVTLLSRLKAAADYLRKWFPALEAGVTDPNTGLEITGKITIGEPTPEQRGLGYRSLDELLSRLNTGFAQQNIAAWLVLDRLDVAFTDSDELEGNALRSLFRSYLDMRDLSQFQMKIFLRDDIWRKIVSVGFREASHVTRTLTLSWDRQSLLNLIVSRLVSNDLICDHYGVTPEEVLASAEKQEQLFYSVFPPQIDRGPSKSKTLDWMITRVADGTKRTAPREVVHLLLEARDEQLRHFQLGTGDPPDEHLIDKSALRAALPRVSKARYEQTLCAEHPSLKPYLDRLEREKAEQDPDSLSSLWGISREKTVALCERLIEVGFLERRGTKGEPIYWVPFLYRDALDLVQGSAARKAKKAKVRQ
ncbi:P-loop ATPase, Sll1717 family [Rivibacter subsaxonicus]|uniref:P-loop ATPase, Sll1717 family n=1 Tax=Rivibacter subsaxonicus TaxID=457575 RepID=UPI00102CF2EC|nr:hypothetical protein [Rivibacter subsaxonicus]